MIPSVSDIYAQKDYFNETSFSLLMRKRIYQILLISSVYDAFMLEEDGRIDEQIFYEYMSLNLRFPPRFILATSTDEAMDILQEESINLIICMLSAEEKETIDITGHIKDIYPDIPIVVLTPFSREVSIRLESTEFKSYDYLFSWLGNADLLLAVIKLIEDRMNVEHDVEAVGVQTIILVEDNIRFYSSYLPNMYKIIFKQSKSFMREGLNEHQKMIRARGRPKILLATNFEEAVELYEKYKDNLLGIISDINYMRAGKRDKYAGFALAEIIKKDSSLTPILLQSSDPINRARSKLLRVGFLDKNSPKLTYELREFIKQYFAFGDFVFIDPETGQAVERAGSLRELQEKIFQIPEASLRYHIERDHISKWLRARALFSIASLFKSFSVADFSDFHEIKQFIFEAISNFRMAKARGVISKFNRETFDEYFTISRIGEGSIGGKARGLAFLDSLIKRNQLYHHFDKIDITIPKTVVLGTDIFDEFMESNNLYPIALSEELSDEEIFQSFIKAKLPNSVYEDLLTIAQLLSKPVAVRSSSLLEDSHYQPFAGIYNTYMIPNVVSDYHRMFKMLCDAIKAVYASAYYADSKAYMKATSNMIDEEKMAIVIQEVCGSPYKYRYYPSLSGVARSLNYYPIPPEKSEDGIANIAFGLGKYIVDGGQSLRFSPKYPKRILQTSSPASALRETQKRFFALNCNLSEFSITSDDGGSLVDLKIKEAEGDNSLRLVASTYDLQNNVLRDSYNADGKKLITFSQLLKHTTLPLAEVIRKILVLGEEEMGKPIEIEFVMDLKTNKNDHYVFKLLQIRPIVSVTETVHLKESLIKREESLIITKSALGNGIISGIKDVVYVKPQTFDKSRNSELVVMIDKINKKFLESKEAYILIGPGRWGSSDPWLGIPVKWPQISGARLIVESGLENYRIDASQGTHFFQNLTSFKVGYFTINPFMDDGFFDIDFLDKQEAVFENDAIRHVRFKDEMNVILDAKRNTGVVYKPGVEIDENLIRM
ncbi:MAG: phosphoenolpyruvate synthase [Chlorobi bacterium]|nr:phosphoenolpyruvate synthase [Chlorobiota bacterium]